jgi:hypothetical protein
MCVFYYLKRYLCFSIHSLPLQINYRKNNCFIIHSLPLQIGYRKNNDSILCKTNLLKEASPFVFLQAELEEIQTSSNTQAN